MKKQLLAVVLLSVSILSYAQSTVEKSAEKSAEIDSLWQFTTKLDSSNFNRGLIISPYELILGKAPNMSIISENGLPNADYIVRIRGQQSTLPSMHPLVIVDGIPMNNFPLDLNPHDIASIEVVNDLAHYAEYSHYSTAGVLVIQTKKATDSLKISYQIGVGGSSLAKKLDVLTAEEYRSVFESVYANDPDNLAVGELLGDEETDWQDEVYQTGFNVDQHLSFRGTIRALHLPFYLSLGQTSQDGIIPTSTFDRKNINLSLTPSFFNDHLKLGINWRKYKTEKHIPTEAVVGSTVSFDPSQPVYDDNGEYFNWNSDFWWLTNPLQLLEEIHFREEEHADLLSFQLRYKLHFFPQLSLHANYVENSFKREVQSLDTNDNEAYQLSELWERDNEYFIIGADFQEKIGVNSAIDMSVGYRNNLVARRNVTQTIFPSIGLEGIYHQGKSQTVFTAVGFNLKQKYWMKYKFRRDNFVEWENSHAFSTGWNLKEEGFLKPIQQISQLGINFSWGKSHFASPHHDNSWGIYTVGNLPETINEWSVGATMGLLGQKLILTMKGYQQNIENSLLKYPVPSGTNLTDYILTPIADINNKGFEFILDAQIFHRYDWNWRVRTHFSQNQNKVEDVGGMDPDFFFVDSEYVVQRIPRGFKTGGALNSFMAKEQVYDEEGKPIEGVYMTDQTEFDDNNEWRTFEQADPRWIFGVTSILNYKRWTFDFSGRAHWGNLIVNDVAQGNAYESMTSLGYPQNIPTQALEADIFQSFLPSSYYIQDASFFRMDYISLAYQFESFWKDRLNFHVSASVQNAFTITSYSGQDPELYDGVDNYKYPRPRTYTMSVRLDIL